MNVNECNGCELFGPGALVNGLYRCLNSSCRDLNRLIRVINTWLIDEKVPIDIDLHVERFLAVECCPTKKVSRGESALPEDPVLSDIESFIASTPLVEPKVLVVSSQKELDELFGRGRFIFPRWAEKTGAEFTEPAAESELARDRR